MATMIKWIKKKCRRQSLPTRAPPSVDELDNFKLWHGVNDLTLPRLNTSHLYEEIPPTGSPGQVAYAVVSLIQKIDTDDKSGHLDYVESEERILKRKLSIRSHDPNRPLPPTPHVSAAPCPLCRELVGDVEVCTCSVYTELPSNTTCQCAVGSHEYNKCRESLIDRHFTRNVSTTSDTDPPSDASSAIYTTDSKFSDKSSGYYSDDEISQRLSGMVIRRPILRGSRSQNGIISMPRMGSRVIRRSNSANDAAPPIPRATTPVYLSPVPLTKRVVPTCGISRSTEKVKEMRSGCKRKHSIGEADGRQARVRTGLQSYRSLTCNRDKPSFSRKINFSQTSLDSVTPRKKFSLRDTKDEQLKKRLNEYRERRARSSTAVKTETTPKSKVHLSYKELVRTRLRSEEASESSEKRLLMALL